MKLITDFFNRSNIVNYLWCIVPASVCRNNLISDSSVDFWFFFPNSILKTSGSYFHEKCITWPLLILYLVTVPVTLLIQNIFLLYSSHCHYLSFSILVDYWELPLIFSCNNQVINWNFMLCWRVSRHTRKNRISRRLKVSQLWHFYIKHIFLLNLRREEELFLINLICFLFLFILEEKSSKESRKSTISFRTPNTTHGEPFLIKWNFIR